MRKIKELETRIHRLEIADECQIKVNGDFKKQLDDIESKQKEQKEFLKNTVITFIVDALAKECDKYLATINILFAKKSKNTANKYNKSKQKKRVK